MPTNSPKTGEPPLDHPRRQKIYETLREKPGLNWNQLQQETGFSVGVLLFHLGKLEEGDAVIRKPSTSEKEKLFFTDQNVDLWKDPSTRVLFGNESTRKVAHFVTGTPGTPTSDIAEELDLHPVTVRYHIDKLDDHKLIHIEEDGRRHLYYPTDRLSEWFDHW